MTLILTLMALNLVMVGCAATAEDLLDDVTFPVATHW